MDGMVSSPSECLLVALKQTNQLRSILKENMNLESYWAGPSETPQGKMGLTGKFVRYYNTKRFKDTSVTGMGRQMY